MGNDLGNFSMMTTLEQAVAVYLDSQSKIIPPAIQAELHRFMGWFGRGRTVSELTPSRVANYAASISTSDPEIQKKLDAIKMLLSFMAEKGMTRTNLSAHFKPKKSSEDPRSRRTMRPSHKRESVTLTLEGYQNMKMELENLKDDRPAVLDEIRRAAADKDFRENAPLHAARERLGYIDGRVKELESILKSAVVASKEALESHRIILGCEVCLSDTSSREKILCKIVGAREYAPGQGKISCVSPIGKAVMGKVSGDVVEVSTPNGKVCYRIESVRHNL